MKTYVLCSLEDMIELAKYIQSRVYWGGHFILNDEEYTQHRWSNFWDYLEYEVSENRCKRVLINDIEQKVTFIK